MNEPRHFRFVRTLAARLCGVFRQPVVFAVAALPLMAVLLTGCPAASTDWELSKFADKRALILEEDILIHPCEIVPGGDSSIGGVAIKGDSGNQFVLKFRDGQNQQVFVGQAAACTIVGLNPNPVCRFVPTSIIVPESEPSSNWTGQVTGILVRGGTCAGEIYPYSPLRGPDGTPYKCDGKLSPHGTCYGRKIHLRGVPPKHRVEILE